MEYRNPKLLNDAAIDCEVNHPQFGWIPFTAREDDVEETGRTLFTNIIAEVSNIPEAIVATAAHAEQRTAALSLIDQEHARYLVALTGGATVAERDTWKAKEEAARAFMADTASAAQTGMLIAEAAGAGLSEIALATKIIAKADAFLAIIGTAAGLRAKAQLAVAAATAAAIPLEDVEGQLAALFIQLAQEVQTEISKLTDQT